MFDKKVLLVQMSIFNKKKNLQFSYSKNIKVLDSLSEEVLILDKGYKILYANQRFLENRGKSSSEVIGRFCYEVSHNLDKPCPVSDEVCPLNEVLKISAPVRVTHKDIKGYMEINASPFRNEEGKIIGIIEILRDVTEKEREKRESEEKYRNLIEKSNDAILILQHNRIKLANRKFFDLTGYSWEEIERSDFMEGIAPESRDMVLDRYIRRQKGEEVPDHYEFVILTKDGKRKEVEAGVAIIEYQGKVASYCFLKDITEKKKAEDELKKVKDYLDNMISTSQVAITVIDNEGNFSIFNQGAERLTGYKAEEVVGKKRILDFYVEKKEFEHLQKKLLKEELIENFETILLKKDGSKVPISISVSLLKDQEGKAIGSIGISTDITGRKKLEEALKITQFAMDHSADMIFWVRGDGRFAYENNAACRALGYTREEMLSLKALDIEVDISPILQSNHLSELIEKGNFSRESRFRTRDGRVFPVDITSNYLKIDGEGYNFVFARDISERKKVEEALKESEIRLSAIINHTPNVAIESYDINGRVLYWNKAAEKIFGWTREEALGKTLDQLILDKKSIDEFRRILKEVDKSNKPFKPSEWKIKNKQGEEKVVYSTIFPIPSVEGRKEFICMDVDISERKKAEEQLQRSEEKYKFLYEKSPTINLIIGIDGVIKDINEALINKLGYSKDEVIGRDALEFIVPEHREKAASQLGKDFKGEYTPEIEVDIYAKDGSVHSILYSPGSVMLYEGDQPTGILITGIDVTEHKEAEKALRESEEKFRNLAEQSPNMIFINKKGRVVYANQRSEEIMGYSRNEFYSPDFDFFTLIAPGYIDLVKSSFNMHMKDEEITPYEYTLITKEGKKVDAILTTKLIIYEGENAILGTVTDITERKKMEQKMIQANEELKVLNAIASIANQTLNLETILEETIDKVLEVTECHAGGIYILNQATKELELKTCRGLSSEAVKEVDKLKLGEGFSGRIALNGEPIMVEDITQDPRLTRLMKKEGVYSYLGVPLKFKGKILGTLFVITQKNRKYNLDEVQLLLSIGNQIGMAVENAHLFKEAQQWIVQLEAIRNITNRLNKLNDVKAVAFSVMDEIKRVIEFDNCRVFLLSDSKDELIPVAFGSKVEEYQGETEEVLRLKIGEGITGWVAQTGEAQIIDDGERHPRSRHIPGSHYVDESMLVSPMIYEGEVRGVITLSKLGLKQFNQNHLALLNILANEAVVSIENAKLFESLKQAYAKLKEAQEQLIQSEKLRALGEMAGGVAHDFNNLLGAILGRAQLLLLSTQEKETKRGLNIIEKAALDGAETVRRIQEFTRLRTDENFKMLDINEILKESIEITKHKWKDEAQKKGILIQVETNLNQNLAPVAGNPSELREVFVNMILNSVDAMTKGGTLKISSQINENHILATVTDTGIGMSETVKRKVFDPFFTTKGPKGNGLGMSLAYGIIVRHSGKILIESQEGKGTTFTVRLPKRKLDDQKRIKEKTSEENHPENILIIDDEPAIRDLLCDLIQSKGHQAMAVDNSLKGIELFKKGEFGIVFTDLSMPEMSGWEVVKQLKAIEPEVVIVMVIDWGTQVDNKKIKANSVDLLMDKPFEVKKFFEILNQALKIKKDGGKKRLEKIPSH